MDNDVLLRLDDVVCGYGKMTILHGTSFAVRRAAITSIIGPNGAGKSTAFKAIFGRLPVRSGRILLDGEDVANREPRDLLSRGVTYVPQGRNIFPQLSVRHNLEIGAVMAPAGFDLAARIENVTTRFPVLRRKANQQASTLSGGEQKMLEIARALLLDPKLMLIDEPSIGLSPILVRELFGILQELRDRGVTILLIEQNAKRALEFSDDGIVLELGRTRMHGSAASILGDERIGQLFLGGATKLLEPVAL